MERKSGVGSRRGRDDFQRHVGQVKDGLVGWQWRLRKNDRWRDEMKTGIGTDEAAHAVVVRHDNTVTGQLRGRLHVGQYECGGSGTGNIHSITLPLIRYAVQSRAPRGECHIAIGNLILVGRLQSNYRRGRAGADGQSVIRASRNADDMVQTTHRGSRHIISPRHHCAVFPQCHAVT